MIFNSWIYWEYVSFVFLLFVLIPKRFRWLVLLSASLVFCGFQRSLFVLWLLLPTAAAYLAGLGLQKSASPQRRRLLLGAGISVPLASLLCCKYFNFLGATASHLAGAVVPLPPFRPLQLILPVGISFYTFRLLSYLIDVYHQRIPAEAHVGTFALYVSFFPQLMAGPIERAKHLLPQLHHLPLPNFDSLVAGFQLVIWGLFKKLVVADRLAFFCNEVLRQPSGQGINTLLAVYFYAFEIYCDFSGYSDIAIGTARLFGITTLKNFDFPYFSRSISEFWTRWHISLSTWLRDYLFLPISYAVMGRIEGEHCWKLKAATWGYVVGMMATMLLCGLWHGAGWNFVVWGTLHGMFLVFALATKKKRQKAWKFVHLARFHRFRAFISTMVTFHLVSLAWVFFRFETVAEALSYLSHLSLAAPGKFRGHLLYDAALLLVFILLETVLKKHTEPPRAQRAPLLLRLASLAILATMTILFSVDTSNEFIYFKF